MGQLLKIQDLFIEYQVENERVKAVNGVSLEINEGETLGLVGETGAGKTTTALSIMGLVPNPPGKIVGGSIQYRKQEILMMRPKELRKVRGGEITMIFQDPMTSLNPVLTVGSQIMEVYRLHNQVSKLQATARAKEMLELVGIPGSRYNEYPYQFSGGMKQRVMIAIALACNPKLLIADEPTTALDVTIQAQILRLMKNLKQDFNTAMLLITHDLGVVAEVCDKVAIMYAGEIVEYGTLRDVYRDVRHPYTKGLFQSIPSMNHDSNRLETIPGMLPDPSDLPAGCKFHPRCRYCTERCIHENPEYVTLSGTHTVRCHLVSGEDTTHGVH